MKEGLRNRDQLAQMIDLSLLKPDHNEKDVKSMVSFAREKRCIAVFTLPSFIPDVVAHLEGETFVQVGGVVGFPSGGDMKSMKEMQTRELIQSGCTEIDMVVNVGKVKSGRYEYVLEEIRGVIEAAGGVPVKVIFECHYLVEDEIRRLCELSCRAGAQYVKTGTGWAPTGATLENVSLMKSVVGDDLKIKAAGGIRDLKTIVELNRRGAVRFGVGLKAAMNIFKEAEGVSDLSAFG